MRRKSLLGFLWLSVFFNPLFAQIDQFLEKEMTSLNELYLDLHQNPELSLQEINTSKKMAPALQMKSLSLVRTPKSWTVKWL